MQCLVSVIIIYQYFFITYNQCVILLWDTNNTWIISLWSQISICESLKLKTEFKNYSCICAYYFERGEI